MTATPEPLVIRKRRSAAPAAAVPPPPAEGPPSPGRSKGSPRLAPPSHRRRPPRFRIWTTVNQLLAALVLWTALAGVVYTLDPENTESRMAFFAVLFFALFFTLAPLIRGISLQFAHSRLYQEALPMHAARQALMLSAFVVLNAILQMQRAWNGLTALLLFCVFAIIEIVALARR